MPLFLRLFALLIRETPVGITRAPFAIPGLQMWAHRDLEKVVWTLSQVIRASPHQLLQRFLWRRLSDYGRARFCRNVGSGMAPFLPFDGIVMYRSWACPGRLGSGKGYPFLSTG